MLPHGHTIDRCLPVPAHIVEGEVALPPADLGVLAANRRQVENDVVVHAPPDAGYRPIEGDVLPPLNNEKGVGGENRFPHGVTWIKGEDFGVDVGLFRPPLSDDVRSPRQFAVVDRKGDRWCLADVQAAPLGQQGHVIGDLQLEFGSPPVGHLGIVLRADGDSEVIGRHAGRRRVFIDAHQVGGQSERIQRIAGQPGEWLFDYLADQVFDARQG